MMLSHTESCGSVIMLICKNQTKDTFTDKAVRFPVLCALCPVLRPAHFHDLFPQESLSTHPSIPCLQARPSLRRQRPLHRCQWGNVVNAFSISVIPFFPQAIILIYSFFLLLLFASVERRCPAVLQGSVLGPCMDLFPSCHGGRL